MSTNAIKIIPKEEAKAKILKSDYSVKNVKFMPGHDADSMSCSLYHRNKRIATVWDDSWGGGFQYTWEVDMEEEFEEFAKSITTLSEHFPEGYTYGSDSIVDELVNDFEENKQMRGWCKKSIVFRLKSDSNPNEWRTMNGQLKPAKMHLKKKYGDDLGEIANERFV